MVLGSIAFAKFLAHHIAKVYVYDLREKYFKRMAMKSMRTTWRSYNHEYWGTEFAAQYTAMHAAIHRHTGHKNMNSPPLSTKFNKKKKRLGVSKKSRAHLLVKQKSIQEQQNDDTSEPSTSVLDSIKKKMPRPHDQTFKICLLTTCLPLASAFVGIIGLIASYLLQIIMHYIFSGGGYEVNFNRGFLDHF